MINRIRALFGVEQKGSDAMPVDKALRAAAAALLVEAAIADDGIGEAERERIIATTRRHFDLTVEEAEDLLYEAEREAEGVAPLHRHIAIIIDRYQPEERIWIIEALWEVVYADGVLHDLEASLLRRIGGLLAVDDRDRGAARKRVMQRLGIAEATG